MKVVVFLILSFVLCSVWPLRKCRESKGVIAWRPRKKRKLCQISLVE